MSAAHPRITGFRWRPTDDVPGAPLLTNEDYSALFANTARSWNQGGKQSTVWGPSIWAEDDGGLLATANLVTGLESTGNGAWVPNQLEVEIQEGLAEEVAADRAIVHLFFRAVIAAFEPAWGHVAVDSYPNAPVAPFHDGAPVIGWITFLNSLYPEPPALPQPAVRYPLDGGTIFVSNPKGSASDSIAALRAALARGSVLLPARALSRS
ncbi:MAG: hypothetical protein U0271_00655 [Polyangiaceae bacterium]